MIILGILLLLLDLFLLHTGALYIVGIVLIVIGLVLLLLGTARTGGRRWY